MQRYQNHWIDEEGTAVVNGDVTVYNKGEAYATKPDNIYSDDGVTVAANPLKTDSNGYFYFYADDDEYDLKLSATGQTTQLWPGVQLKDMKPYYYDVRSYGAVGDGTTDDLAAFVAAHTAAAANNGTVYVPEGTYLVSASIPYQAPMIGTGYGRSTAGSTIKAGFDTANGIIEVTNTDTWWIENIKLDGDSGSNVIGIYSVGTAGGATQSPRWWLNGVSVYDAAIGFKLYYAWIGRMWGCVAKRCTTGMDLFATNGSEMNCTIETVTTCVNIPTVSTVGETAQIRFSGVWEGFTNGIVMDSCDAIDFDVYWEQNSSQAYFIKAGFSEQCRDITFGGLVVSGGGTATGAAIQLDDVDGFDLNCRYRGGSHNLATSTTANTRNFRPNTTVSRLDTASAAYLRDGPSTSTGSVKPIANFMPNPNFEYYLRGYETGSTGVTATNCTISEETTIVRSGSRALKVTGPVGMSQGRARFRLPTSFATELAGKTLYLGAWVYVPDDVGNGGGNNGDDWGVGVSIVSDGTGGTTDTSYTTYVSDGQWQWICVTGTIGTGAPTYVEVAFQVNDGTFTGTGNEYIIIDHAVLCEFPCDEAAVARGQWYPDTRVGHGFGLNWVGYAGAAPTDTDQTFAAGDVVYDNSPSASGTMGWVCVSGGSPGTWKTFGAISA